MVELEKYIKCKYCSKLCIYGSTHLSDCITNWNDDLGLTSCYSCGIDFEEKIFSQSQLEKGYLARCKNCTNTNQNNIIKYEKFVHLYKSSNCEKIVNKQHINKQHINKQLIYHINKLNEKKIYELLKDGADPNYIIQMTIFNEKYEYIYLYDSDGNEIKENDNGKIIQPLNSLRLCIFRLCDCTITNESLTSLYNIAKLLIEHGADKNDGLIYYNHLYGNIILHDKYNLLNLLLND